MPKVQVWASLSDQTFQAYASEAERQGVKVENLVEQTVNTLLQEFEHETREGTDHPIIPS